MQLTVTAPNETLEALAVRVYDLGEKPSQAATREAAKALAEANPVLRRIADVPAGTVVEVPPIERGTVRTGATQGEAPATAVLVAEKVAAAAALAQRQLLADIDAETGDAKDTVKLARSAEVKKLRTDAPELSDVLPQTIAAADARGADAGELRKRQQAVFAQIAVDLGDLTTAFAGGGEESAA